jgi:hypothetical protein
MPAVVSKTVGSYELGTSDADGTRRCPFRSKNDKYRSRISAALMGLESRRAALRAPA